MSNTKITQGQWKAFPRGDTAYVTNVPAVGPATYLAVNISYADARLIAAAPELLAALIELNNEYRLRFSANYSIKIDALIAKATGGAE